MEQRSFHRRVIRLLSDTVSATKTKGLWRVVCTAFRTSVSYLMHCAFRAPRGFWFQGRALKYVWHFYNQTWNNERAVELPIIWAIVNEHRSENILEVGNVLSHYYKVDHTILDKYEEGSGIINDDVVDFRPTEKYELIVSISTLEHVGWDEAPQDPSKILRAIENLRQCLAEHGTLIFTLPLGLNPHVDEYLKKGDIACSEKVLLKRISKDNQWREVDWQEIGTCLFNVPYPFANGLVVGVIRK